LLGSIVTAQVRQPDETLSAGEGAGPLSDISTPLRNPSVSVHDGAQTLGESSSGSVHSGPVRDSTTRSMLSGPVSEISRGPMRQPQPSLSGGSQTEASAGAVKHDIASPLGERISQPLRELGALQQQMRERRERAALAALSDASQPMAPPVDALGPAPKPAPDALAQEAGAQNPNGAVEPAPAPEGNDADAAAWGDDPGADAPPQE
jgi:hypothetical protein